MHRCQKTGWKAGHSKQCGALSNEEIREKFEVALKAKDWKAMRALEGLLERLLTGCDNMYSVKVLQALTAAHTQAGDEAFCMRKAEGFEERVVVILGEEQRFRDQGEAMCVLGHTILTTRDTIGPGECDEARLGKASAWFQRARTLGEHHGFFQLE